MSVNGTSENARVDALQAYKMLDTEPEDSFDRLTRLARAITSTPMSAISLIDRDRQWLKSSQGLTFSQTTRDNSFCTEAIKSTAPTIVPDTQADERFNGCSLVVEPPHIRFYLGIPLVLPSGHAVGALCVYDTEPRVVSSSAVASMCDLARMALDAMEFRRLATVDSLTNTLTPRGFAAVATTALHRAQREAKPLSCIAVDVDRFRELNAVRGHACGDSVLRSVADVMRKHLRRYDAICRLGGGEFVVLLPDTDSKDAVRIAERLRKAMERFEHAYDGQSLRCTASFGVSGCEHDIDIDVSMARANSALHRSKVLGRNIVSASDPLALGAA